MKIKATKRAYEESKEWDNPAIFSFYESRRKIFRPASREVITSVFSQYLPQNAHILEVGSGCGELVYHLLSRNSTYRSTILQSDQKKNVLFHKKIHPTSNIVEANVYDLPFPNESFDAVVGYACFDTFLSLPAAIKEVKRVLKPGGIIIHFIDLRSSPEIVLQSIYKKYGKKYILFPKSEEGEIVGFQLIPKKEYQKKKHTIEYSLSYLYEGFLSDPKNMFLDIQKKFPRGVAVLFSLDIQHRFATSTTPIVRLNESFTQRLKESLELNSLKIEFFDLWEGITIQKKTKVFQGFNVICSSFGYIQRYFNPKLVKQLGKENLLISSRLHVTIASK